MHIACWGVGDIYLNNKQYDKAEFYFKKAIDLAPEEHSYHYLLGCTYTYMKEIDKAIFHLEKAIELDDSVNIYWEQLGWVVGHNRDIDKGIEYLKKSLSLNPKSVHSLKDICMLYTKEQRFNEALVCIEKAERHKPDDPEIKQLKQDIEFFKNEFERLSRKFNKNIENSINQYNQDAVNDFEGFVPEQMHQIIYDPFNPNGAIKLNRDIDENFIEKHSPFYKLAKALCRYAEKAGKIKLTKTGNITLKPLKELYNLKIMQEYFIEKGYTSLSSQDKWIKMCAVVFGCEFAGIIKKWKGYMTLTKKGRKLLNSKGNDLFFTLFESYTIKFSWAYFDGYENEHCGQLAFMFSLWLLKRYGTEIHDDNFYSKKYITAFPKFREMDKRYTESEHCYKIRFLECFCNYFGFINTIEKYNDKDAHNEIWKFKASSLLLQLIK